MKNKILVVAAHPDDEVLGAGGTMLRHKSNGDAIHILLLSNGESSRDIACSIKKRIQQAKRIAQKIGATLTLTSIADNQFDSVSLLHITKIVEKTLFKVKPSTIYTHFAHDLNIDHRLTFQAVLTACRPQPGFFVPKMLSFEVLSSTEWQSPVATPPFGPTEYINIEKFIEEKIDLMKIYRDELRPFPHPRSVQGIKLRAQYRGMEVGLKYAEAFQLIRAVHI